MSLHAAAQHLAAQGRGPDTTLVHMTPGEVKGLQALAMAHGGSLSINPRTGLVEAGWLSKLLPTIAGIGLSFIPGVGPLAAAGMVGGFETLRTGDIGKGLMAGLGAYGGAGLTSGLSTAGAATVAPEAGAQAVGSTAAEMSTTQGMTNALAADTGVGSSMGINSFDAANVGQTPLDPSKVQAYGDAYAKASQPSLANASSGFGQLGSEAGRSAVYNALPTGTLPALGATAMNAMTPEPPPMPGEPEEDPRYKGAPYRYNLSPSFSGAVPRQPQPYYRAAGLGYAAGGDIMLAAGGSYDDEPRGDDQGYGFAKGGMPELPVGTYHDSDSDTASLNAFDAAKKRMAKINKAANMPKGYAAQMPQVRGLGEIKPMASGGLGAYSDGGHMLKGPGDGMSDSIPANIGGKQPARLADGEFVIPADVVSHLGNGSTDAGAKKLYAMMDKVRTARTGRKAQGKQINANKYLPRG